MRVALAVALLCGACNSVFGVDVTTLDPGDRDDDGVIDSMDNCPDDANADQVNGDDDGLGDACDDCPGVFADSNHDEDLDLVPDACDVCPAHPDFQVDSNGDGVGNICDGPGLVRTLFDGFATLDPAWNAPAGWSVTNSDTLVTDVPLDAAAPGIALADVTLGDGWRIAAAIVATERWHVGDRAGIVATSAAGTLTRCELVCSTEPRCSLELVIDDQLVVSTPVPQNPRVVLVLFVQPGAAAGDYSYSCKADTEIATTRTPPSTSWVPGLIANPTMQVGYFEVMQ